MSNHEIQEKDAAIEIARRIAEEEGIGRRPQGLSKYIVPTIAVLWSSFQLSVASWLRNTEVSKQKSEDRRQGIEVRSGQPAASSQNTPTTSHNLFKTDLLQNSCIRDFGLIGSLQVTGLLIND